MSYRILATDPFEREIKQLAKKHRSLKADVTKLISELSENPEMGTPIGNGCFKIRMAITSKGKGKSGGARIITHFYVINAVVYLLSIYDKSEQANISDKQIQERMKGIPK